MLHLSFDSVFLDFALVAMIGIFTRNQRTALFATSPSSFVARVSLKRSEEAVVKLDRKVFVAWIPLVRGEGTRVEEVLHRGRQDVQDGRLTLCIFHIFDSGFKRNFSIVAKIHNST